MDAPGVISSPEVLAEAAVCTNTPACRSATSSFSRRYANEFRDAGYEAVMRSRHGRRRWYASAFGYDDAQLDRRPNSGAGRDRNVVGYDPDVFVSMGFAAPEHDRNDDRSTVRICRWSSRAWSTRSSPSRTSKITSRPA